MSCVSRMKGEISMLIKLNKSTYSMGESIPVQIIYENNTFEVLVTENPSKSFNVLMHFLDNMRNEDFKYTMGKIIVTIIDKKTGEYVESIPEIEQIEIAPKSSFLFITDLNDRLSLYPGEFDCFCTLGDIKSNHIKVTVTFTNESVEYFLKLVLDKKESYGRREWAMEWLQQLKPDFKLKLPNEEDEEVISEYDESYNSQKAKEFEYWWIESRNSKQVATNIEQINKKYFEKIEN